MIAGHMTVKVKYDEKYECRNIGMMGCFSVKNI
jgi:hypothetical protein